MNKFPDILNVNNKDDFFGVFSIICLSTLRQDIYKHVIKEDENTYFDIDVWKAINGLKNKKYKVMVENSILNVINELNILGWKCKTSFGGTGLFIYSSEKPPASCYDEEF